MKPANKSIRLVANDVKFDDNDGKKRTLLFYVLSLQPWCIFF